MRAIQIVGPRKIAMLDDAPRPEPAEGEVLVRCTHVGLCGSNISQYFATGLWGEGEFPNPIGWSGHENIGIIVESRCDQWEEGELVLANSVVISNTTGNGGISFDVTGGNGGDGGGIYSSGTLTLVNSTVSSNISGNGGDGYPRDGRMFNGGDGGWGGAGGGIYNAGTLVLTNSTVSRNTTGNGGGGSGLYDGDGG